MKLCKVYAQWVRFLTSTPLPYEVVRFLIKFFPHPRRCVTNVTGIKLALNLSDLLQSNMYVEKAWEPHYSSWWRYFTSQSTMIVDVGAHIGYYSFLASHTMPAGAAIHAFEPNPRLQLQFQDNHQLNPDVNVTLIPKAVGHEEGEITLHLREAIEFGTGSFHNIPHADQSIDVPMVTLDLYRKDLDTDSISLVKIDIEGAEIYALEGMKQGISQGRYEIFMIELHPNLLPEHGNETIREIFGLGDYHLFELGFPNAQRIPDDADLLMFEYILVVHDTALTRLNYDTDEELILLPKEYRLPATGT